MISRDLRQQKVSQRLRLLYDGAAIDDIRVQVDALLRMVGATARPEVTIHTEALSFQPARGHCVGHGTGLFRPRPLCANGARRPL